MKERVAYDDAVDLLEAEHKVVKKMFMDHAALCEKGGSDAAKYKTAQSICQALTMHAQIEEEVFYPLVRETIGTHELMDDALEDHAQAKEMIEQLQAMDAGDLQLDNAVKQLDMLIDQHVLLEREQIFLKARNSALDLREMTLPLLERRQQLKGEVHMDAIKGAL